jgi:hypothetical protein
MEGIGSNTARYFAVFKSNSSIQVLPLRGEQKMKTLLRELLIWKVGKIELKNLFFAFVDTNRNSFF